MFASGEDRNDTTNEGWDVLGRCVAVTVPVPLPSAATILEACAWGMATARITDTLVTFDYTSAGLASSRWRPVGQRETMRKALELAP